jgi:ribosome-associated protein
MKKDFPPVEALLAEAVLRYSRSSGPGGQHVNKVETRVSIGFDVAGSALFSEEEKAKIAEKCASKISREGLLWVHADAHRSQRSNQELALKKLHRLLQECLEEKPPRKASKPTQASVIRRIQEKQRRSEFKKNRGWRPDSE